MSKLIGLAAMLAAVVAWPRPAMACGCGAIDPTNVAAVRSDFLELVSGADAAFSGRIYSLDNLRVTFRVDQDMRLRVEWLEQRRRDLFKLY